jgi:hypothetical protein
VRTSHLRDRTPAQVAQEGRRECLGVREDDTSLIEWRDSRHRIDQTAAGGGESDSACENDCEAPRDIHALRSFGAWYRQASVMSGVSSRTVTPGRFTRTAGNPL